MSRILLVDDEPLVAKLHARAVIAAGHETVWAEDAEAALEEIAFNPPAMMITDMNMPGMSGIELAAAARQKGFDRPIILLSGDDHVRLIADGLRAGIDDFLVKGMPFALLTGLLHQWCGGPYHRLPAHIRASVLTYLDRAWPLGPPIQQLRAPLPQLEARVISTLKDLLLHSPDGFGASLTDHLRLFGAAEGILLTLTRSDPLARLRIPGLLITLLKSHPDALALAATYDTLNQDATYLHARQTLRLS